MPSFHRSTELRRSLWVGVEELNQALAAEILAREAQGLRSASSHNRGGWKSPTDLHTWRLPEFLKLVEMISVVTDGAKILRMWAIVNRNGSEHLRHRHQGRFSGVYYVTTGGAPSAPTMFEFYDGLLSIEPEPGLFVLFPAAVEHWVEKHHGTAERITIAFDVG